MNLFSYAFQKNITRKMVILSLESMYFIEIIFQVVGGLFMNFRDEKIFANRIENIPYRTEQNTMIKVRFRALISYCMLHKFLFFLSTHQLIAHQIIV